MAQQESVNNTKTNHQRTKRNCHHMRKLEGGCTAIWTWQRDHGRGGKKKEWRARAWETEREREQKREGQASSVYRQLLADLVLVDEGDAALGNGSLLAALAYDVPEFFRVLLHTTHTEAGAAREGVEGEAHTPSVSFLAYARALGTHTHAQQASHTLVSIYLYGNCT